MPDREKVLEALKHCFPFGKDGCRKCPYIHDVNPEKGCTQNLTEDIISLLKEQEARWIPIVSRPMDEEERKEWSERLGYEMDKDEAVIYTSPLPDDGDEVITCDRYGHVIIDTFCEDEGCYFETPGDMDGIVAWQPKPEPYKPPKEEEDENRT